MVPKAISVISEDKKVIAVLSQIAGGKKLGQRREPKWFHPFPARLPLVVAKHLIESLTTKDAVIVDPMVGSGTTLVAARQLGRKAVGFDRDHMAVRIAKCASRSYSSKQLDRLRTRILENARSIVSDHEFKLPQVRADLPVEDQDFVNFWFPTHSQKQLFALAKVISALKSGSEKDFAWVVFSSLIIAKSTGTSYAIDIARSRPHRKLDKLVAAPFDVWDRRFRSAASHLPFIDEPQVDLVEVRRGDARKLSIKDQSADFILTSPPYRNAIDYLRCHKFSLVWMGHELSKLRELRGTMIGSERGLWELDGLPPQVERRLQRAAAEPRQVALARQYLSDMRQLTGEIQRVLRPGGLAVVVVGPTMINSRRSDAADVFSNLAIAAGLRFIGGVSRTLDVSRRSLPPPQQAGGDNSLRKRMRREIVIALRKPSE